jgi:hypothetical protein
MSMNLLTISAIANLNEPKLFLHVKCQLSEHLIQMSFNCHSTVSWDPETIGKSGRVWDAFDDDPSACNDDIAIELPVGMAFAKLLQRKFVSE